MAIERIPCVVIGAGVVGLAVARAVATTIDTVVVEAQSVAGAGNSSRNSEVIHAGIYYPPRSAKAHMCLKGREMMYKYLRDRNLPHKQIGKLLVSTSCAENEMLDALLCLAHRNGVSDVVSVTKDDIRYLEPLVEASQGLLSPSTGILDSHALLLSLQNDLDELHCPIVFNCTVNTIDVIPNGFLLHTSDGSVECSNVINCAGLSANRIAASTTKHDKRRVPRIHFLKGSYMKYSVASAPFCRLIYPLPSASGAGLGVHATIDLAGTVKFGPDATWIHPQHINSNVNKKMFGIEEDALDMTAACDADSFAAAIATYYPTIDATKLSHDYAGVRAKLWSQAGTAKDIDDFGRVLGDFIIEGEQQHGVRGLVNLFGIESPGLTSAFAIAEHVAKLLK